MILKSRGGASSESVQKPVIRHVFDPKCCADDSLTCYLDASLSGFCTWPSLILYIEASLALMLALKVAFSLLSPSRKPVMDTFFISHGSPTLSIDDALPARHFLKSWQQTIMQQKPRSILVISGHWETAEPTVNVVERSDTIHDFYGFPKSMYKLKYPAPGAPNLAKRVKELLVNAGFEHVKEDKARGLDHGAWVPLMLMYPEAEIPVCQLSVQTEKDGTYHYNIGKALTPLREEGVLIIGSGSATHNLRALQFDDDSVVSWASQFDSWLTDSLLNGRHEDVNNYDKKAPYAKMAHPWPDHFYPLHVALGAAGEKATAELIHSSWSLGSLSYSSYRFITS